MNLLLDTHALIWWFMGEGLASGAEAAIADPDNLVYASAASIWEISIKQAIGKLAVSGDIDTAISTEFEPLPITFSDARMAGELPSHHRDPFDRMLLAQAIRRGLTLVSRDPAFPVYGVSLLLA